MTDKSYVTMEQNVCPVCGQVFGTNALLLDKRLRSRFERYTVTGWGMCPEHKALMDQGYIALVGIDPDKSKSMDPQGVYRTGEIAHVRANVWEQIFDVPVPEQGMAFVEPQVINLLQERMTP